MKEEGISFDRLYNIDKSALTTAETFKTICEKKGKTSGRTATGVNPRTTTWGARDPAVWFFPNTIARVLVSELWVHVASVLLDSL